MPSNNQIKNNVRQNFAQKIFFNLLIKIKFGRLIIHDAFGTHYFSGIKAENNTVNIYIKDSSLYSKILFKGSIAAGESYVHGEWEVDDLTRLVRIIIKNNELFDKIESKSARLINYFFGFLNYIKGSNFKENKKNILAHYDLGNEFFAKILDPSMMYSCALYEPEDICLADASIAKLEKICQQLQLKSSDHVLEIGSGWGGFAFHAAKNYGCKITTTTISNKQYAYVKNKIQQLGLADRIELLNCDYRELKGSYDKVVSIEMIEAIGHRYFSTFFRQCNDLLKPNGLLFIQAILMNDRTYPRAKNEIDFIRKYIFPGGCLPSTHAISYAVANHTKLQLIHWHDIGKHYVKTLQAWLDNLNQHVEEINRQGFSEEFIRMWRYYFCYCMAAFEENHITDIHAIWQNKS